MNAKIIAATPFGPVAIIWTAMDNSPKIARVLLSRPGFSAEYQLSELYPKMQAGSCPEIDNVAAGITRMLEGGGVDFSLGIADLNRCTGFQRRVLQAEHAIPRGRVSTYRLIARHLGKASGARAVGNALATNPFPLIVPCHRAVRSDGHLGGYQGGVEMKRALLEKEGIPFDPAGRVVGVPFHYGRIVPNKDINASPL
jgi:methylated-DNA-[protein]-cysteine S-methyltransferase